MEGKDRYIEKFEMDKALSERGSLIIYLNQVPSPQLSPLPLPHWLFHQSSSLPLYCLLYPSHIGSLTNHLNSPSPLLITFLSPLLNQSSSFLLTPTIQLFFLYLLYCLWIYEVICLWPYLFSLSLHPLSLPPSRLSLSRCLTQSGTMWTSGSTVLIRLGSYNLQQWLCMSIIRVSSLPCPIHVPPMIHCVSRFAPTKVFSGHWPPITYILYVKKKNIVVFRVCFAESRCRVFYHPQRTDGGLLRLCSGKDQSICKCAEGKPNHNHSGKKLWNMFINPFPDHQKRSMALFTIK